MSSVCPLVNVGPGAPSFTGTGVRTHIPVGYIVALQPLIISRVCPSLLLQEDLTS
jgi:hypothetical protein